MVPVSIMLISDKGQKTVGSKIFFKGLEYSEESVLILEWEEELHAKDQLQQDERAPFNHRTLVILTIRFLIGLYERITFFFFWLELCLSHTPSREYLFYF